MIRGYDDWKLDTPDNHVKVMGECPVCECDIYHGEDAVARNFQYYHEDCFYQFEEALEEEGS